MTTIHRIWHCIMAILSWSEATMSIPCTNSTIQPYGVVIPPTSKHLTLKPKIGSIWNVIRFLISGPTCIKEAAASVKRIRFWYLVVIIANIMIWVFNLNGISEIVHFSVHWSENSGEDGICSSPYCDTSDVELLSVHEYRNDRWRNLGNLIEELSITVSIYIWTIIKKLSDEFYFIQSLIR